MPGRFETEKGLGDGISSLFTPIFDAINRDDQGNLVPENERIEFPETARRVLNAFFSAKVQSSFSENSCGKADDAMLIALPGSDDTDEIFDIATPKVKPAEIEKAISQLSDKEQALLRQALNIEEQAAVGTQEIALHPEQAEAEICYKHTGTSATISKGLESNIAGFQIGAPGGKVAFNMSFAAKATIVGQEPKTAASQTPDSSNGFVPPAEKFTGEVEGDKELTKGGVCGEAGCRDEWVKGTCKITILFGIKVKAGANVPDKLKEAIPAIGLEAGFVSKLVYSFGFLHYPRNAPAGIADPGA